MIDSSIKVSYPHVMAEYKRVQVLLSDEEFKSVKSKAKYPEQSLSNYFRKAVGLKEHSRKKSKQNH